MCKPTVPPHRASLFATLRELAAEWSHVAADTVSTQKKRSAAPAPPPPGPDGKLTLAHVAQHHTEGDAWVAVKGKVRGIGSRIEGGARWCRLRRERAG